MTGIDEAERWLSEIAARATTLRQRMALAQAAAPTALPAAPDDAVEKRLVAWCDTVSQGDWDAFGRRLAWDDLDRETARRALAPPTWPDGSALPAWADTLREVLARADEAPGPDDGRTLPAQPLPFEEIVRPFGLVARRRLAECVAAPRDGLADGAYAALEHDLLGAWVTGERWPKAETSE